MRVDGDWVVEQPSPEPVRLDTSIAVTSDGIPHIFFVRSLHVHYVTLVAGEWQTEQLWRNTAGSQVLVWVDTDDKLHAVWHWERSLWHSTKQGDSWAPESSVTMGPPDADRLLGANSALAIGEDGTPHVAFLNQAEQSLNYAVLGADGWTETTVSDTDASNQVRISLVVNAFGQPHISHAAFVNESRFVRTSFFNGSTWNQHLLAPDRQTDGQGSNAIALDSTG